MLLESTCASSLAAELSTQDERHFSPRERRWITGHCRRLQSWTRRLARAELRTRDFAFSSNGPMAQSYLYFRHVRKQNLEYVRQALRRWQSWGWRQNFELNQDFTLANFQIHQTAVKMLHHPNERDEDGFDYGASIDRATAHANQHNQLPQTDSPAKWNRSTSPKG